jgi:SAM-dependent methyltransferase
MEPVTPADVVAYYEAGAELTRLDQGIGALERERTLELLRRWLEPSATVLDVGGGTGVYASELLRAGHTVTLVEPVALHRDEARRRVPEVTVVDGDARALPFADETFGAVLLLGPLYHLSERLDRVRALEEAGRVVRPGGVVAAAAISRHAPLLDTLRRGTIRDERVFANVRDELATGRRVAPERRNSPFPDGYFHLPEELEAEVREAALELEGIFGVEGPGWLGRDFDEHWQDATMRERILAAARTTETDPRLISVSPHLLAVARKP